MASGPVYSVVTVIPVTPNSCMLLVLGFDTLDLAWLDSRDLIGFNSRDLVGFDSRDVT
jgi:hypothetical protein